MNKDNGQKMQKGQLDKDVFKKLLSYLKEYKLKLIIVLICIVFSSLSTVAISMSFKNLIDNYITPLLAQANPVFASLLKYVITMAFIYFIGMFSTFIYTRFMVTISQGVLKKLRDDMFVHMQKLPIKYFDTNSNGDVMSYYTNDIDTLKQLISQSIPQAFSFLITIISVIIAMFYTSFTLTVMTFVTVFLMMQVSKKLANKSGTYFVKQQESLGDINGYIEEMINGQKVVKVFCYEDKAKDTFNTKNEELRINSSNANKFANLLMPVMFNLGNLQYVLIAIFGGLIVANNVTALTIGGIIGFLNLIKTFNMSMSQVLQQINYIIMAFAGAKRIFDFLDEKPEEDRGYVTLVKAEYDGEKLVEINGENGIWAWKHPHSDGTVTYKELKGEVYLNDVDFGYTDEKMVLHNVSLYAKSGQKVALVGATGAGKTTITNLINRFYDISDGKIKYDNININKIKKEDLRNSLGIVLQDTNLFTGTIMENIRYGNLAATDEQCINAAKKANAHWFIELLPNGYETVISGNGSGLSQGQRQLLSIARVIIANPPFMILDEATSSIDTHTEAIVQRGMDKLMEGRTVFVIAHRLSTIQNSDVIIVLEKGCIIEKGNHEELLEKKGKYYQLYTGAFNLE